MIFILLVKKSTRERYYANKFKELFLEASELNKIPSETLKTIDKIVVELKQNLHWHKTYEPP